MKVLLQPIHKQVIVITGASSGIGLVTARLATTRGARVVVTARNEEALHTLPYTEHAKNYLAHKPLNPPPVYAPEIVAETILYCAEHPVRDIFAGGGGKILSALGNLTPWLTDKFMEASLFDIQQSDRPDNNREVNSLNGQTTGLKERGGRAPCVSESSLYTQVSLHPFISGVAIAAVGLMLGSLFRGSSSNGFKW